MRIAQRMKMYATIDFVGYFLNVRVCHAGYSLVMINWFQ